MKITHVSVGKCGQCGSQISAGDEYITCTSCIQSAGGVSYRIHRRCAEIHLKKNPAHSLGATTTYGVWHPAREAKHSP